MAGRIAIDFGTSNTRISIWDSQKSEAQPFYIPEIAVAAKYKYDGAESDIYYIPSLIHYDGSKLKIGKQVLVGNLNHSPNTFKWIKKYISNRLEVQRNVGTRKIKYTDAGADYLEQVLNYINGITDITGEEIAFTVPVESYEHYQDWFSRVCEQAGITRWRLLDEASAAALGYNINIQANDVYMVFDFGGGTLDVSIVKIEANERGGKKCRILGKSGRDTGGSTIDTWLFQDILKKNKKIAEDVSGYSSLILYELEKIKEKLTFNERASVNIIDPDTGSVLSADYTRSSFEDLLEENGLYSEIISTIQSAQNKASERGYSSEHIKAVLLVGGSSLIPSVRRTVRTLFGDKVKYHRPLDAVALGGAAFVGGAAFYDHIQHDYALRYYNRAINDYDYLIIVPAGTDYPTKGFVKELTVKASMDGQKALGIDIFEIGQEQKAQTAEPFELIFDENGNARMTKAADPVITSKFWINEKYPTFITADPPAEKGDKRFPVQFSVDGNKRLCVTIRDNANNRTLYKNHPIIRLT